VGAVGCSSDNGDSDGDDAAAGAAANPDGGGVPATDLDEFSFFVTSLEAMRRLSGSDTGFGGDLRYDQADGLAGADRICTEIAEYSMAGAGQKGWRAFLSVTSGPDGAGPKSDQPPVLPSTRAVSFNCSRMGIFWGHFSSHSPHSVHSLAGLPDSHGTWPILAYSPRA